METATIIVVVIVLAYVVWVAFYLLVVDRLLRVLMSRLFGVNIERRWSRVPANPELTEALFMFSWRVVEPLGWFARFTIGFVRLALWLCALIGPVVLAVAVYIWLKDHVPK